MFNYFLKLKAMIIELVLWAEKDLKGKSGSEKKKAVVSKLMEMLLGMTLPWYISWAKGVAPFLINYLVDLACQKLNFLSDWNFESIELNPVQVNKLASVLAAPIDVVVDSNSRNFEDRLDDLFQKYAITEPIITAPAVKKGKEIITEVELPQTGNIDNQLSKNLTRKEVACKCGCGFDIVDIKLVDTFQAIRDYVGKPIYITSGCRCPEHNKKVGGEKNSAHIEGMALDMYINGLSSRQFGELAKKAHKEDKLPHLRYCYLISNSSCIHMGVDEKARKSIWGW